MDGAFFPQPDVQMPQIDEDGFRFVIFVFSSSSA
jgi:hypothetical protein